MQDPDGARPREQSERPALRWWQKLALAAIVVVVFLIVPPVLFARLGYHFVPSEEWVAQSHLGASVLGWAMLVVGPWMSLIGARMQNPDGLGLKWVVLIPFGAWIFYLLGYASVTVGVPFAANAVFSKSVTLSYEVEDLSSIGDGKCRRPIELKGLPLVFDTLCGFPQSLRDKLRIGETIMVTGQGTRLGLFPEEVSR